MRKPILIENANKTFWNDNSEYVRKSNSIGISPRAMWLCIFVFLLYSLLTYKGGCQFLHIYSSVSWCYGIASICSILGVPSRSMRLVRVLFLACMFRSHLEVDIDFGDTSMCMAPLDLLPLTWVWFRNSCPAGIPGRSTHPCKNMIFGKWTHAGRRVHPASIPLWDSVWCSPAGFLSSRKSRSLVSCNLTRLIVQPNTMLG